jgi:copper chaperone CopZ
MHMVIGFVLASLLKKKGIKSNTLPSIFGKFDVVHAIPGRIRYFAPLLEDIDKSLLNRIENELSKIDGIKSVHVNPTSGSLILTYDETLIKDHIVHGIVLKLLGLEKELDYSPEAALLKELKLIGRGLDHQIHKSSVGLLDFKTSLMMALVSIALYRIIILRERSIPSGFNLLWWSYVMAKSGK